MCSLWKHFYVKTNVYKMFHVITTFVKHFYVKTAFRLILPTTETWHYLYNILLSKDLSSYHKL